MPTELEVTVDKEELMARVQANRDQHRAVFESALVGFQAALEKELTDRLALVRANKRIDKMIRLPEPEDHTTDYDRIIDMLSMHQDEQLEISSQDFARFVRDDWEWKRQWAETASNYTVMPG